MTGGGRPWLLVLPLVAGLGGALADDDEDEPMLPEGKPRGDAGGDVESGSISDERRGCE